MPWKIQSVIGERWRLIKALLRKEKSLCQVCRVFGISRKTAYKWKNRFTQGGRGGLQDRSRRPRRMPERLAERWIERIRGMRKKHRDWGPKKIRAQFERQKLQPPSARTIGRWLKRLGLSRSLPRRPRKACVRQHPALTMARRPNHVWTVDFKGWFRTGNGERCEPLTVRDLYSRYGLLARLLVSQHGQPLKAIFTALFRQKGLPEVIRIDNGSPFASRGPAGLSRLSAWWVRLGIRVEFTRPGCPQDNGAHEQFHRVMKRETTRPVAWTRRGQQHRTTIWLRRYNQERPHEALGQRIPSQLYQKSSKRLLEPLPELQYGSGWVVRRVRSNGEIRWRGRRRFIGEAFIGQMIGLRCLGPGIHAVYFTELLIGHLHERDMGAMRPAVYKHQWPAVKK